MQLAACDDVPVAASRVQIIFIWNYETGGILEAATFVKYTPDANYIVHIFENYDGAPQADMVQDYSCCLIGP